MAWAPSTTFEDDLVNLQPEFNFIHGQVAYELKRQQEMAPRPKSTYEYLNKRDQLNEQLEQIHGAAGTKSKEIRASLAMMERLQQIAGTKPLGEHATLADWDDTSTVDQETVAMMRHFGMNSMAGSVKLAPPQIDDLPVGKIHVIHNGSNKFPLILDPNYFAPRKTRQTGSKDSDSSNNTSRSYADANQSFSSDDSHYVTAYSHLSISSSSQEQKEEEEQAADGKEDKEIPYMPLEEESMSEPEKTLSPKGKKKTNGRLSQKQRRHVGLKRQQYNL